MVGTIPGFKIIREIGKGGMSTVYLAIQESTDRQVALKVLSPHLMGSPIFSQRLQKVADVVSSLDHPNVVAVYEAGQAMQSQYVAMEYIPLGDLKSKLEYKEPIQSPLRIIQQVAKALAYVHSQNYVHRDIKPENILLRQDHSVAITGFGIAKSLDTSAENTASPGMIVGTPTYMSPEQAMNREIDERSDIYSLGVVLHEVLTWRPLYTGIGSVAAAVEHISHPIPKLPEPYTQLQPLLEKMVAKDPNERFSNAKAVIDAITPLIKSTPESTPAAEPVANEQFAPIQPPTPKPEPTPAPVQPPRQPASEQREPDRMADAQQESPTPPANFISLGEALSNRSKQNQHAPSEQRQNEQSLRMERMEKVRQQEQSALESLRASDPDLFHFEPPTGETEPVDPPQPEPLFDPEDDIDLPEFAAQDNDTVVMKIKDSPAAEKPQEETAFSFKIEDREDDHEDELDFKLRDLDEPEFAPDFVDPLPEIDNVTPTPISDTPYNGPTKQPKYTAPQRPESTIVGVVRQFPAALIIIAVVILVPAFVMMQMQGSDPQTADQSDDKPVAADSENLEPEMSKTIESLLASGLTSEKAGQLEQAAQAFQKVLALNPNNEEGRSGLTRVAGTYLEQAYEAVMDFKDLATAEKAMNMAKRLEPNHQYMKQVQSEIEKLTAELAHQQEQQKLIQPEIDALLALAEKAMEDGRLVDPPGESADDYYSRLLVVDENNPQALEGLQKIADYYSNALDKALQEKSLAYAQSYFDSLRKTAPQHPKLGEYAASLRQLTQPAPPPPSQDLTQPGIVAETAAPISPPDTSQLDQLQSLLAKARYAMDREQLMFPHNDNAYAYYTKILEQSPSSPEAIAGLEEISRKYLQLSSRALNNDDLSLASAYANRSYDIVKTHDLNGELREKVEEMRAIIYRITYLK